MGWQKLLLAGMLVAGLLPWPVQAQGVSPEQMQQLLNMQRIPIRDLRNDSAISCKEDSFLSCSAGYNCSAVEPSGRASNIEIVGKVNDRCHITTSQPNGNVAQCHYRDQTMQKLYWLYQQDTVGLGDALAIGQMAINECEMFDANGKALGKPVLTPNSWNKQGE